MQKDSLQDYAADASDPQRLREAVELAFHYRGDVTIARQSGAAVEGYVFDRRIDGQSGELIVRLIPSHGSAGRIVIPFSDIASISFSGRDTASGKSFETWVKKYVQKKRAGESANIESEPVADE